MKPTLVIMAAGMGSRFGGLKQLEPIGPNGETILEYSIKDAMFSGFGKVVFIIKKEIEELFKEKIGNKIEQLIQTEYAFQELDSLPIGYSIPFGRTKPFGTAHAILCSKEIVSTPFLVINADDFYGRESFLVASQFLKNKCDANNFAMVGFPVENTLTENGSVSRGVCEIDLSNYLQSVVERTSIFKDNENIKFLDGDKESKLEFGTLVSMNMWCLHPYIFSELETKFKTFLDGIDNDISLKKEFYIPSVIDELVKENKVKVEVLKTTANWYGITYKEDKENVKNALSVIISKDYK